MYARAQLSVNHALPSLFSPGRNCCAVAHAARVALLVDGEDYFRAFAHAAERARRSIVILGWDFSSTTRLIFDPEVGRHAPPPCLGDFLNWLVRRRHGLQVYVLDWDYPMVFGVDREFPPIYGLGWKPHRHVHVAYDNTHPVSGSHHQKIVVIDDAIGFLGGFDLTDRRWDTCAHSADDARRVAGGSPYPPFHDLMMAVDGEAARVLGGIARWRWQAATGHALTVGATAQALDPWPPNLPAALTHVEVALARTLPGLPTHEPVREVEQLYLDMIGAARARIYIENQYFTAYRIGEALAARLAEPDGPEIVVLLRLASHGWLEEHTMHVLRTRLINSLREADRHGRLAVYYAHIDGLQEGTCIDVHSKLMIVDDEILRIGSANLCNRSMGMDSECDAAIEARGDPRVASVIAAFRERLLGEHLDVPADEVHAQMARSGTLRGTIEALAGKARTLKPLEHVTEWPDAVITLARVADPERPVSLDQLVDEFSHQPAVSTAAWRRGRLVALVVVLLGLTALWRYTPLAEVVNAENVTDWAREFAGRWWAPLVILAAYTPACFVMFPRPLITLGAVIAFGPLTGFALAMSGILIAALVTYLGGQALPRDTVRRLAGEQLNQVTETLRRRSLLAITALRLVPLAPFAVEGLVAGAIHLGMWPFMLGTFIGMLPGTLGATVFGGQLETALRDPSQVSWVLLASVVVVLVVLSLIVRNWLLSQHREPAGHGGAHR
jgi:phosphatidylserine/phosphatidylglycerophosphate/cardiolipin synthase-like enzyme/uncharacterized membrane protein YdjX (TVP38/TMEM64 family)